MCKNGNIFFEIDTRRNGEFEPQGVLHVGGV
jgi:hypothetical protein